jgi:hypothetical protein
VTSAIQNSKFKTQNFPACGFAALGLSGIRLTSKLTIGE